MLYAKLQARLESSEPKCANCEHWGRAMIVGTVAPCRNSANMKQDAASGTLTPMVGTTDLSVCSKWEMVR